MDNSEYATHCTEVSLGSSSDSRDLRWTSIEDFELFIRGACPVGEITSIRGDGYTVQDGDEVPSLKLVIFTMRLRADIEREEVDKLAALQFESELAAQEVARLVLIAQGEVLLDTIEQLEAGLSKTLLELAILTDEYTDYFKEVKDDDL